MQTSLQNKDEIIGLIIDNRLVVSLLLCMDVQFDKSKELKIYKAYVENPADRQAYRAFTKTFPKEIADEAYKRHCLLKRYPSAKDYNDVYGSTQNRIEKKEGVKDKDPFILKVRVNGAWRKFFNIIIGESNDLLLKKDWIGQFDEVKSLYVIAVNNHDYNKV